MSDSNTFEHVNLADVDLTYKPVPEAVYELQIMGAKIQSYEKNGGGQFAKFQFAIGNDPNYSGRRVFAAIFPDSGGQRDLKRLSDATLLPQSDGEPFEDWITRLNEERPRFLTRVGQRQAKRDKVAVVDPITGDPVMENIVIFKEASPVV